MNLRKEWFAETKYNLSSLNKLNECTEKCFYTTIYMGFLGVNLLKNYNARYLGINHHKKKKPIILSEKCKIKQNGISLQNHARTHAHTLTHTFFTK